MSDTFSRTLSGESGLGGQASAGSLPLVRSGPYVVMKT